MRIAVDARSIYQEPTLRGIGKSAARLYDALARHRPGWRFDLFYQTPNGNPDPLAGRPNVAARRVDGPGDRFGAWANVWMPVNAWRGGASVLHAPGSVGPPLSGLPMVATIHDLTPLRFRRGEPGVAEWGKAAARTGRVARRVLTASRHSAADLRRTLGVPLRKIEVVPWGPSLPVAPPLSPEAWAALRAAHALPPRPYLLHLGMKLARKNTRRVIEAWAGLGTAGRGGAVLAVAGLEGAARDDFARLAASLHVAADCAMMGYVAEAELSALMAQALGLVYVPLDEGFGLPILDAFAHGTPVVASSVSSMPEVAGDAGLLVDPTQTADIAAAMQVVAAEPGLRDELRDRGSRRLGGFSWDGCAAAVASVFEASAR